MKFFKEAFENVSIHHGSDSMSTIFMKEKQRAEHAQSNMRQSMQTDDLLDEPVTISGAPTNILKQRRMSARKNARQTADTMSNGSFQKTGSRFFASGTNPAVTQNNFNNQPMSGDIQSIIDGFSQE